jgi:curved DNA-binding protein CbpA
MDFEKALKIFNLETLDNLSFEELRSKYKQLAKDKHPDKKQGSSKDFVELREAYVFLSEFGIFAREQGVIQGNAKTSKLDKSLAARPRISDLRALTKDEILSRYFKDTQSLESQIGDYQDSLEDQAGVIVDVKENVQKLLAEFEAEKKFLQEQLEKELIKLEKKYNPSLLRKLLFFIPKMSDKDFRNEYQNKIDYFSKQYSDLNISFFKLMLSSYGDGLNKILMRLPNNSEASTVENSRR